MKMNAQSKGLALLLNYDGALTYAKRPYWIEITLGLLSGLKGCLKSRV